MKETFAAIFLAIALALPARAASFRFSGEENGQNREMRLALEVAALRLNKILGINFTDTIDVRIVQTQEEFDELAGAAIPEWGAGAAIPGRNLIILREPMMNRYPGNTADLLQHELAHIALSRRAKGGHLPRFIDEGFASWFAGEWTFSQVTTIAAAQITKSLLPLRDIDDVNRFHQGQANLAYAQSYVVVNYLFKRFGELAFTDLVDSLAAGRNLSEAFHQTLDISFWRFEADYRKFLSDNYTLFAILSDMTGLWIILALIVVFGWLLIRKRKKDAYDRWKDEEKFQSTDFDYSGSDDEPWKDSEEEDSTRF
ncbi:MAG: peptidase MA family metallohydrolase [Candidatus Zixiibacteriota bacterium]